MHLVRRETLEREYERLPYEPLTQEVLSVPVRKVVVQVVAGRNIAVLVEAAVRSAILQLRGVDTYQEFVERHRRAMELHIVRLRCAAILTGLDRAGIAPIAIRADPFKLNKAFGFFSCHLSLL